MSRRRPAASIVANPVLVGAVTTLVIVVAVFLAYNANNGLPFVPTRQINVRISNGANLVPGNEVRQGGYRVGVVEEMTPVQFEDGRVGAELKLKLDKKVGLIPVDSTWKIRPRSSLGLKYVEFTKGDSRRAVSDGYTFPASQSIVPVELDEFYNMFDEPTRDASRENLKGFGNTFAFRGPSLNTTIERLPELFGDLEPVMRNLADPDTDLGSFFKELGDAARVVAPVAKVQSQLFTDLATTFEAFSRDPEALEATIAKGPGTLDEGVASLRVQRPFLADFREFSHDLRAAAAELRPSLPTINAALETGTPVVRRSTSLNDQLEDALGALRDLTAAPGTMIALRATTATISTLNPQLRFLGPYATVCNYWNYFWTMVSEHVAEEDPTGTAERTLINTTGRQDNSLGASGAIAPANGEKVTEGDAQHLHGQVWGAAVTDSGMADCENGQRGYPEKLNTVGDQRFKVAIDPHTPGAQGPTYRKLNGNQGVGLGRDRVPEGETFTREPETGPQLDPRYPGLREP